MKNWWILLFAASAGAAIGAGSVLYEQSQCVELFFTQDFAVRTELVAAHAEQAIDRRTASRVEVVGDAVFDFGSMERNSTQRHVFQLKNVGASDLTLESGETTCKCTVSKISLATVPPGQISEVTVEWTGKTLTSEPDFAQTANVKTNDPDHKQVELKIQGYVTETIRVLPEELVIGNVSSNTGAEAEFRLFGFRNDRLDILETTCETPDTANCFDVSYEPLSLEEVKKEKGATCGQLAKVTIKPGLPVGPIIQTIRIRASGEKEAVVELPVVGQTLADIRIASTPKFNSNRGMLTFGAVNRSESAKEVLQLYVTGAAPERSSVVGRPSRTVGLLEGPDQSAQRVEQRQSHSVPRDDRDPGWRETGQSHGCGESELGSHCLGYDAPTDQTSANSCQVFCRVARFTWQNPPHELAFSR